MPTSLHHSARPRIVTLAAVLQLLIAVAFLISPVVGLVFGGDVQAAAEAEAVRQGIPADALGRNHLRFDETGGALVIPIGVAVIVAVLAYLNLSGRRVGWTLSLIVAPIVIALDLWIATSQAGVVTYLQSLVTSSGDPTIQGLDISALLAAVDSAYPAWTGAVTSMRLVLTPLAGAAVIVLLLLPVTRAWFRKRGLRAERA